MVILEPKGVRPFLGTLSSFPPQALPSEYCEIGRVICKQRRYLAKNPHVTRKRHFKHLGGQEENGFVMSIWRGKGGD